MHTRGELHKPFNRPSTSSPPPADHRLLPKAGYPPAHIQSILNYSIPPWTKGRTDGPGGRLAGGQTNGPASGRTDGPAGERTGRRADWRVNGQAGGRTGRPAGGLQQLHGCETAAASPPVCPCICGCQVRHRRRLNGIATDGWTDA